MLIYFQCTVYFYGLHAYFSLLAFHISATVRSKSHSAATHSKSFVENYIAPSNPDIAVVIDISLDVRNVEEVLGKMSTINYYFKIEVLSSSGCLH